MTELEVHGHSKDTLRAREDEASVTISDLVEQILHALSRGVERPFIVVLHPSNHLVELSRQRNKPRVKHGSTNYNHKTPQHETMEMAAPTCCCVKLGDVMV